ncbi:hypothetical protein Mal15_60870 [Stieleria maiorica]|uniref:Uncharacterized protein n=1 Tax=Stieleria maiorica TaxID=2795974 RepID=A0A5B9MLX9_9BACT|nr:hypothetical protein [Stieleria maiorica]QEG02004.1 hypothetical protein Mal15_60870 [Stieleria maiorica]
MSTGRSNLRTLAITAAAILPAFQFASFADAGCLDWLFGRTPTYTANYGYAGAPVTVTPLGAPTVTSGAYQAQRPGYGYTSVQTFDNPSVYTGMPAGQQYAQRLPIVNSAPVTPSAPITSSYVPTTDAYRLPLATANRVPISTTLRGTATANPITASPVYTANYPGNVAPVTYNAVPTNYAPLVPVSPQPPRRRFGSGLARFFNSLLGRDTNYVTSYYTAPITYYRPVSTVDPMTGTTVTVQQPCSSYVQQLQRVPYNSSFPLQSGAAPVQTTPDVCSTPTLGNTYPQSSFPLAGTPGSFAPPASGIGQVGGQFLPGDPGVTTIPSTIPDSGFSNTAPLTGGSPSGSGGDPSDQQSVPQPRLESGRPELNGSATNGSSDSTSTGNGSTGNGSADNGYFNNNGTDSYGDDLYPYGSSPSESSGTGDDDNRPAIQLDPPVTRHQPNGNPGDRFGQQFTAQTPSAVTPLSPPASTTESTGSQSSGSQWSTLRPIGVPAGPPTVTQPTTEPTGQSAPSQRVVQPPSTQEFQAPEFRAPPLPAPSSRGADPSALFRNTESSASSRSPSQLDSARPRVSVPVREATTRHQSVRQVAAWEDAATPAPTAPRQPTPVKRDSGGWLPAR